MGSKTITSFLRIFFLIFLQALVVSRMQLLDGFVLPWVYIFGILMLPFETPKWLVLVLSFATGYFMDLFTGPMGMHMTACVVLGWLQPLVQRLLSPREGYDAIQEPTIQRMPEYLPFVITLCFFMQRLCASLLFGINWGISYSAHWELWFCWSLDSI